MIRDSKFKREPAGKKNKIGKYGELASYCVLHYGREHVLRVIYVPRSDWMMKEYATTSPLLNRV